VAGLHPARSSHRALALTPEIVAKLRQHHLRPADRLGQERSGRRRLRIPHPRPGQPAGLTAPVSRPEPRCHPSRRAAGTADPSRRRLPVPHAHPGQPGSTRPIPSLSALGGSRTNRQQKITTGLTSQGAKIRRYARLPLCGGGPVAPLWNGCSGRVRSDDADDPDGRVRCLLGQEAADQIRHGPARCADPEKVARGAGFGQAAV
jgi:hypothetical protein